MSTTTKVKRLPQSVRKHVRREKARLRATLPPAEAAQAIERLMRGLRQGTTAEA